MTKEELRKPKIVEIVWIDVMSLDSPLMTLEDIENLEPCKARIVGYLVKETKENYYLAKEWWETGQFKYLHIVPKISVLNINIKIR